MDLKNLEHTHNKYLHEGASRKRGKVELFVRCENLADLDIFSKTDPMCVLFIKQLGQWGESARTEAHYDTFNPSFAETFILDLDHHEMMKLKFSVYDIDSRSTDLARHDHVGSVETTLRALLRPGEQVTENFFTLRVPGDPQSRGQILITAESIEPMRSKLQLHVGANLLNQNLVNKVLKAHNSVLEVRRKMSESYHHPVYRSESITKTSEPRWRPFTVSVQKLCNGDPDRQVELAVLRLEGNNSYHFIGSTTTTLRSLLNDKKIDLPLSKTKKHKKDGGRHKSKGHIRIFRKSLDMAYTLTDYIRGGCSLRLMVAVDFTLSNGTIETGTSLHQLGDMDNEYIDTIKSIGSILSRYHPEQNIPAFGFGAKLKAGKKPDHCFPLNGSKSDPFCEGIKGVLKHYKKTVNKATFAGPSKLAPVIREAGKVASLTPVTQDNQHYQVCLIITDGVVNDLDDTITALAETASSPLSVVIVGVGPADFSMMEEQFPLSVDMSTQSKLNCAGQKRTNVHFTSLRRDKQIVGPNTGLIRESIGHVSAQMIEYLSGMVIAPNAPVQDRQGVTVGNWADASECTDSLDRVDNNSFSTNQSLTRTKSRSTIGPSCPTCGSDIEAACDSVQTLNPSCLR